MSFPRAKSHAAQNSMEFQYDEKRDTTKIHTTNKSFNKTLCYPQNAVEKYK